MVDSCHQNCWVFTYLVLGHGGWWLDWASSECCMGKCWCVWCVFVCYRRVPVSPCSHCNPSSTVCARFDRQLMSGATYIYIYHPGRLPHYIKHLYTTVHIVHSIYNQIPQVHWKTVWIISQHILYSTRRPGETNLSQILNPTGPIKILQYH